MKLSSETIGILKNFATINSNIWIFPGKTIRTLSPARNIWATVDITEEFPVEFAIYDLSKFLSTLSIMEEPDLTFKDKYVEIKSKSGNTIKYHYCDTSLLAKVPAKMKNFKSKDVIFDLSTRQLDEIKKAANVLQVPDILLENNANSDGLVLKCIDSKDDTSNTFSLPVTSQTTSVDFTVQFKIDNLKLLSGKYEISICKDGIAEFVGDNKITYYIATEAVK